MTRIILILIKKVIKKNTNILKATYSCEKCYRAYKQGAEIGNTEGSKINQSGKASLKKDFR